MRYQYPAAKFLVLQLYMYCWLVLSHRYTVPLVPVSVYVDSSTAALIDKPFGGVIQIGVDVDCTGRPLEFLSWNFTGTVLPALKTLWLSPVWYAVSLMGCKKPFH